MIRSLFLLFACLVILAACASGRSVKSTKTYSPAEFQISDVRINVPAGTSSRGEVRRLMRNAATNLALAHNDNASAVAPEYVMEVAVNQYKATPVSQATLRYDLILRQPNDGRVYRSLPVTVGNDGSTGSRYGSTARGLIRDSMPEAFKQLYGHSRILGNVRSMVAGDGMFDQPIGETRVAPASYTPSPATESSAGEPQVIACDVC